MGLRPVANWVAGLFLCLTPLAELLANDAGRQEVPGVSGLSPTLSARPGQTLPLQATRRVAFTTDEATGLQPDVSPDGKWIVFAILGDIYRLPITGGEAEALTRGMAFDSQPVFSPDGRWIAFLSDRSGAENVWVMRSDGSQLRQLGLYDDDPIFASPAWSADGKAIYVSRYWPDRNAYELWAFDVAQAGLGRVVIANGTGDVAIHTLGVAPSADGKWLYHAARTGNLDLAEPVEWRIVRTRVEDGASETLVDAVGDIRLGPPQSSSFRPALSHDSKLLAYTQRRVGKTWLRLRNLASGEDRKLVELDPDSLQASYWSDIAPHFAFLPGGGGLVFSRDGKLHQLSLADAQLEDIPFTASVELELGPLTRAPTRVKTGPVDARIVQDPVLSPDGKVIAFSAIGSLYVMPATGGVPTRLAANGLPHYHPSWSADGKRLLSVSWTAKQGGHVWEADLASGTSRRLTQQDAFYTHAVYAPDGSVLVVRSPSDKRRATYVEFGQFREAELVHLAVEGSGNVIATGQIGGTPHFLKDGTLLLNRPDGVYRVDTGKRLVGVKGPNWYFAEGAAQADDIRVSPDGRHALAKIAQQLFLVDIAPDGGTAALLRGAQGQHRLTASGADFFGWSADGVEALWSLGSTITRLNRMDGAKQEIDAKVLLPRDVPTGYVLLSGADVITMGPHGTVPDADILIHGDRIVAIGLHGSVDVPPGARRHDVSGKYIIPGLVDVHDHVADIKRDVLDFEPWGPRANLAYGVTTTFDPSTLTIDMLAYQDAIDAGLAVGSRIFSTGTAVFAFNDFRSPEEVRDVLARYRDNYGLTNIKMYRSGNRRVRQWIAQEALVLGLQPTTEGALAAKLDLTQILDGYSGNEHAIPPPVLHNDVVQLLARSGTSYDLTLQITHGGYPAQDYFIARDAPHDDAKYARFAPQWFREQKFWARSWRDPSGYWFPKAAASAGRVLQAGGLVAIGAHGEVPGLGTHWEMQAHAMGGIAANDILRMATINGAKTIGREADLGSIEPGKLADMVVLDADPQVDIANSMRIAEVMKGGRLYSGDTLEPVDLSGGD